MFYKLFAPGHSEQIQRITGTKWHGGTLELEKTAPKLTPREIQLQKVVNDFLTV